MSLRVASGPVRGRGIRGPRAYDPFIAAGFTFPLDVDAGLIPGGYACSRDVPILLPQADGGLAAYASNAVPFEWYEGRRWVRTDPAWAQHCLWSDEITGARGWTVALITPDVNAGGVPAPYPGGGYTRCTVNTAGLALIYRTVAVTPGSSETLSFLVRLGTLAPSDLKFGIYNETAGAWIAVNQVPTVTPSASQWTRCDVTVAIPAGCTTIRLYPFRNNFASAGATFYLAAVCGTPTGYPVPFAPAGATAVNVGPHSWVNSLASQGFALGDEFTLFAEYMVNALSDGYQPIVVSLSDTTFNESVYLNAATLSTPRSPNWAVIDGGVGQANTMGLGPPTAVGQRIRSLLRAAPNRFRSVFNGALTSADTSGSLPTVDRIYIANNWSGAPSNNLPGRIRRIGLQQTVGLSDALMQYLSAM